MTCVRMILAKGRERSLLRRHPWIFSGAVKNVTGSPAAGETLEVVDFVTDIKSDIYAVMTL